MKRRTRRKRRYLDLAPSAGIFLFFIGLLLIVLPALFYLLSLAAGKDLAFILGLSWRGSLFAGALLLAVFFVLVVFEQVQDFFRFRSYRKLRNRKTLLSSGGYECTSCGSRTVEELDASCDVCGSVFIDRDGGVHTSTD